MSAEAAGSVLVIDDHPEMVRVLQDSLRDHGYRVEMAVSGAEGIERITTGNFDAVICDLRMAEVDGLDVLHAAQRTNPDLPFIVMTAFGGVESAVEVMKAGAFHYITKPFRLDEVVLLVGRAIENGRLRTENRALKSASGNPLRQLRGKSAAMKQLHDLVTRAASAAAPVLIRGESGTGKELVARSVHELSARAGHPFVPVNCTAIPAQLLESELFGHVKGAFTGASSNRRGLFLEADGGTLFLDELGDMPLDLQAKLLRVLEDGELRAVGSDTRRKVDVRIVAATHQELELRVREGRFRQDLFYRLNVVVLRVPPLRERRDDIPELAQHFLERSIRRNPTAPARRFSPEAITELTALPLEGNVRELENLVERLVVLGAEPEISADQVRAVGAAATSGPLPSALFGVPRVVPLRQLENDYIAFVIAQCGGNKTRAAELLGIDVSTIHRREKGER